MECFVSPVVAGNLSPLGMASCRNNTPHNARARCALSLVSTTRLCVAQHTRVLHALARLSPSRKRGDVAVVPRKQSWLAALGRVCPSGSVLTHHARLSHDGRVWLRHARARCRCAAVRLTPTSSVVRRLDLTQFLLLSFHFRRPRGCVTTMAAAAETHGDAATVRGFLRIALIDH